MVSIILKELSTIIDDSNEMVVKKECIKELINLMDTLKLILEKIEANCSSSEGFYYQAALVGLRDALKTAQLLLNTHKCKRRLYWIICLDNLNQEVEKVLHDVASSLHQLQLEEPTLQVELSKLAHRMEQVHFEAVDDENKIKMLTELGVQELIVRLSQKLGINFERDTQLFSRELRYFKTDIETESDSRKLVDVVDDMLEALACENSAVLVQEGGEVIPSFEAFECPLTKQIMKDPVVLESEHTYERHAIEEWFKTCRNSSRQPTCPISGAVLTSTELQANVVLRKTIEEWYQRNVVVRIEMVYEKLRCLKPMQDVDAALDELLRLVTENSKNISKLKKANLIPLIAKIWTLDGAAYFRSKALVALEKLAEGDADNQAVMVNEGMLRNAIRSLGSREEEEKANAARLLYTLSENADISSRLGTEKGGMIHLIGLTASKVQDLAAIAEKTLNNLEQFDENILGMAEAGRLQPLLTRLREGNDGVQVKMANFLAKRHLVKSQKKLVAQTASDVLLGMLTGSLDAKEASLGVFLVLSSLKENKGVLINAGLLSPLLNIMFNVQSSMNKVVLKMKETAAEVVCNLVSSTDDWENVSVDAEGNTLHSEFVVHSLLGLMEHAKPNWKNSLLNILIGLVSSPQVADEICQHVRSGYGIKICFSFLSESAERSERQSALKLLSSISTRMPADIIQALECVDQLHKLKELLKSKSSEERGPAAYILGGLPLAGNDVSNYLEPELVTWTVDVLSSMKPTGHGRSHSRNTSEFVEGLLGILLHFLRSSEPNVEAEVRQHDVMKVLVSQLGGGSRLAKQRAGLGIKHLSERALSLTKVPEPPANRCFCFSPKSLKVVCPVHGGVCESVNPACMIESRCLGPVLELLEEEDESVQLAGIDAVSTLLVDGMKLRGAVEELVKVDGLEKIFEFFYGQQRGEAQDRSMWVVERVLRVEEYTKKYSIDGKLFKALIEAFKNGNPVSRGLAQDALTSLKELSGVSAGNRLKKHK